MSDPELTLLQKWRHWLFALSIILYLLLAIFVFLVGNVVFDLITEPREFTRYLVQDNLLKSVITGVIVVLVLRLTVMSAREVRDNRPLNVRNAIR